jgi:NarL family two-component system sensor histidine kinase YdfH
MGGVTIIRRNTHNSGSETKGNGGWLFYLIISVIVIAGYLTTLKNNPHLQEPLIRIVFTGLVIVYIILLWMSPRFFITRFGLLVYLVVQGTLSFIIGWMTPGDWLAVILYMSLIGFAMAILWPDLRRIAAVGVLGLALSTYHLIVSWGWHAIWQFVPTLFISFAFVIIYVVLFTRQTQALERVQSLLHELENAHHQLREYADRVEELTINQERQRMAQELHDTLVQGLAGLILQLEAVDSHLETGHTAKAQQTAQRAMTQARSTMDEARRAIQDLRSGQLENNSLVDALALEVDDFAETTGIQATFQVDAGPLTISPAVAQHILRITQESLTNVRLHAGAEHVAVRLEMHDHLFRLMVEDDGCGFYPDQEVSQPGKFGLRGMRERAERIGGVLLVSSEPGKGTAVLLETEMADDPHSDC